MGHRAWRRAGRRRASSSCSRRSGEVSTSTGRCRRPRPARPGASSAGAGSSGLSGSHAPQSLPTRGTPPDEPQPRIVIARLMRRALVGRGTLREQAEERSRVVACAQFLGRDAAHLGQQRGGVDTIGGLVALAAIGHGREVRRVGFDEDAVERHVAGDVAQLLGLLEGQDAGERHVEPSSRPVSASSRDAGETMEHGAEGPLPHFLAQDLRRCPRRRRGRG